MNAKKIFINNLIYQFDCQTSHGILNYKFDATQADTELLTAARAYLQERGVKSEEIIKDRGHAWRKGKFINFSWNMDTNLNLQF